MSRASNSPTSRLLQNSRLFSLPRGLPPALLERPSAQGSYRASDTATLPYPTHQAITTPNSSRFRGDWGLKRPLPAKSTRNTSTPVIRVHRQDTPQHITDFASAADHVLTERKWTQMGIPIMRRSTAVRGTNRGRPGQLSAYEDSTDNVAKEEEFRRTPGLDGSEDASMLAGRFSNRPSTQESQMARRRWKSEGPWIAGMQEGEFDEWLTRAFGKSEGFRDFVGKRLSDRSLADTQARLRNAGEFLSGEELERFKKLFQPTDASIQMELERLRKAHQIEGLSSELTTLICDFYDLPRHQAMDAKPTRADFMDKLMTDEQQYVAGADLERAPPTTHPAAGLGFIRTGAFMDNHPIHGPQAQRTPILGRVIRPRNAGKAGADQCAQIGVGGIVAKDTVAASDATKPNSAYRSAQRPEAEDNAGYIDPDTYGGNKVWVRPESAWVNEAGRIIMQISRSEREAQKVKTGDVQDIHQTKLNEKVPENRGPSRLGPITGEAWPGLNNVR